MAESSCGDVFNYHTLLVLTAYRYLAGSARSQCWKHDTIDHMCDGSCTCRYVWPRRQIAPASDGLHLKFKRGAVQAVPPSISVFSKISNKGTILANVCFIKGCHFYLFTIYYYIVMLDRVTCWLLLHVLIGSFFSVENAVCDHFEEESALCFPTARCNCRLDCCVDAGFPQRWQEQHQLIYCRSGEVHSEQNGSCRLLGCELSLSLSLF